MIYKLVVSDMDGTLLNSNHAVSEENKKVLKDLLDQNIQVAIATGRIYTSARVYARHLGILTPIIACNGAIVRNLEDDNIIYESHISKEDCFEILELCRKYNLYFHFYTADTFYTERLEKGSLKYSEWNKTLKEEDRIDIQLIDDAYQVIKETHENIYKFQIICDDVKLLAQVRDELEKIKTLECSKSWHNNLEIMNNGATKWNAIKHLAHSLGITDEEIVCIGDNENDINMLMGAGLGIAMGNAEKNVKDNANYVTDTNDEDGVAKALRKFVL